MVILPLLTLLLAAGLSFGQSAPNPEPWPDRVWSDLSKEVDRSGSLLTNVIFEQLDDFSFSHKVKGIKGEVGIGRSVRDNQDVMNSWTVNDEIYVDLSRNETDFSFPLIPAATTPLNLNLGIGGQLKVNHIRQVLASKYHDIPTVESELEGFETEQKLIESPKDHWYDFDPSLKPRFSKLWNPLLNFYRIPLTKHGLRKIGNGEIISYSTSGYVSVGLETGLVPLKLAKGVDVTLGVGVQAILKGEFRITLLKEDDRFVRVKLTRMRSQGGGITVGAKTNDIELYEGFLIFEDKKIETRLLNTDISVVPFNFSWEFERKTNYNLGFRYDLEDPIAEEAFEKAMRGNFSFSEKHSESGKGIAHIMTRNSLEKKKTMTLKVGTDWLANWKANRQKNNQWITLERPDGTSEIFKSSLELSKSWSTFWGTGEKKNFLFTSLFNKTDNSFQLVAEIFYEDVRTSADEMHGYIHDVKKVIGDQDVLPDLPLQVPSEDGRRMKKPNYNRSSFYFGHYFSETQIMKFLMTPAAKAWEITLKSFDYVKPAPLLKLKAKNFFNRWMYLQSRFKIPLNQVELTSALEDLRMLFNSQSVVVDGMSAILATLDHEEVDYFLTATNNSFGRVQLRGRAVTDAERLLQMADETFEFENKIGNFRPNPEALIKDLKVVQEKDIEVTFNLPVKPSYLFFKVIRTSGWKRIKTIKEFVYLNKGKFKEGNNTWVVSKDSSDRLDQEILDCFKESDYYTFQVSSSPDRKSWGSMVSSRFSFKLPEP